MLIEATACLQQVLQHSCSRCCDVEIGKYATACSGMGIAVIAHDISIHDTLVFNHSPPCDKVLKFDWYCQFSGSGST